MRIALDLFGGDNAPNSNLNGALLAIEKAKTQGISSLKITLFGEEQLIKSLDGLNGLPVEIDVLETPNIRSLDTESSFDVSEDNYLPIRVALRKHRAGEFDGVVSAGRTGIQVKASIAELERCNGITRPAVAATIPTLNGFCLLLDVGASLTAKPQHLLQFASMGTVYTQKMLGKKSPSIGLLDVAEEKGLGEKSVIEAYNLLSESEFKNVQFVEGRDILIGKADIVIVNGFTGNALLKLIESLPTFLKQKLSGTKLENFATDYDYQMFGGEPLLGVKGVSMICHGASTETAIASAILKTVEIVKLKLPEQIERFITIKFSSYISQVKYLGSFRRTLRQNENNE